MSADSTEQKRANIAGAPGDYVLRYGKFQGYPLWYIKDEPGGLLWLDRHCDELIAEGRETPTLRVLLKFLDQPSVRHCVTQLYRESAQQQELDGI